VTPAEIRVELARRAGGIVPLPAHYLEDPDPEVVIGDVRDFCRPCAFAAAGNLDVRREQNSDSDVLRSCDACGALLDYRVGPEDAAEEIEGWEESPPRTARDWAELLHAMAEVPPEDFREPGDPPVDPSPLWARVEALLTRSLCMVPRDLRTCEVPATCAGCSKMEVRSWCPGDEPTWRRAPAGWLVVGQREFCSTVCRDRAAVRGRRLAAMLLGTALAIGVDVGRPRRER
jgi:hypothetical protein